MDKLENKLKSLVLTDVIFTLDGKVLKRGKIKLFNTKQFFIRFKMECGDEVKDWELPYPFKLEDITGGILFNYCLSAFCPPTELAYYKMKMIDKSNVSKLHDSHLHMTVAKDGA